MSKPLKNLNHHQNGSILEVKSKFDAEFRRFSLDKSELSRYDEFCRLIERFHSISEVPFSLCYTDPIHGDLLPINNDENFARAVQSARPLLRLLIQRKGDSREELNARPALSISLPEDFRQVSSIIDVDVVPDTCRRVRLVKHGSDKPLGFYIRDGTSVRVTPHGLDRLPGIFISRLVPGGLAEGTGLLAVNDEVLEVNGIEVGGKTLDQVTDMMVANSSNLIITIRPANQCSVGTLPRRGSFGRSSQMSHGSHNSNPSVVSDDDRLDEDEIRDHTAGFEGLDETPPRSTHDGVITL
ncbi:hypothetical protein MTO96_001480 [Rhipicephalus appendiculatus]